MFLLPFCCLRVCSFPSVGCYQQTCQRADLAFFLLNGSKCEVCRKQRSCPTLPLWRIPATIAQLPNPLCHRVHASLGRASCSEAQQSERRKQISLTCPARRWVVRWVTVVSACLRIFVHLKHWHCLQVLSTNSRILFWRAIVLQSKGLPKAVRERHFFVKNMSHVLCSCSSCESCEYTNVKEFAILPGENLMSWSLPFGCALRHLQPGDYCCNTLMLKARDIGTLGSNSSKRW